MLDQQLSADCADYVDRRGNPLPGFEFLRANDEEEEPWMKERRRIEQRALSR
jgi:hypothetical protein